MVDALVAMNISMLWITAITAISVVVERMNPQQGQEAAEFTPAQGGRAPTAAASKKEAWDWHYL